MWATPGQPKICAAAQQARYVGRPKLEASIPSSGETIVEPSPYATDSQTSTATREITFLGSAFPEAANHCSGQLLTTITQVGVRRTFLLILFQTIHLC
uniref:Uncharacterized protein n=1 Tax=Rhipicephalus zambeziensis TaxID=60191 RepID=A0A224Y4X2_9ACAR